MSGEIERFTSTCCARLPLKSTSSRQVRAQPFHPLQKRYGVPDAGTCDRKLDLRTGF